MPSPILRGTLEPQLQRYTIQYSPNSGTFRTYDYKGFGETLMTSLLNTWVENNCEVTLNGEQGVYTLSVKDTRGGATGDVTLDTWQIQQQTVRFNRTENPKIMAGVSLADLEVIARALKDNSKLEDARLALADETHDIYFDVDGDLALRVWKTMTAGFTQFDRSTYILRHTTNAPSNYASNVADFNVDCIYTEAQLLTECQNTGLWRLPLPPAMVYFIQHMAFPAARSNYQNGWFKRGSSRTTSANYRIDITTEYEFGQHSTDDYELAA